MPDRKGSVNIGCRNSSSLRSSYGKSFMINFRCRSLIAGIGFGWGGKHAIPLSPGFGLGLSQHNVINP